MAITPTPPQPKVNRHSQPEGRIQAACVKWLRNTYPETRGLYFHIPNEINFSGDNAIQGAQLKALGLVKGVADTILLMARSGYHALCVEFKTDKGRQSAEQQEWQRTVEREGYRYVVCRSLEDFKNIINGYFDGTAHTDKTREE